MKRFCHSVSLFIAMMSFAPLTTAQESLEEQQGEIDRCSHNLVSYLYPHNMTDVCPNLLSWLSLLDSDQCMIMSAHPTMLYSIDESSRFVGALNLDCWREASYCGVFTNDAFLSLSSSVLFPHLDQEREKHLQCLERVLLKGSMTVKLRRLEEPLECKQKILRLASLSNSNYDFQDFSAFGLLNRAGLFFVPRNLRYERVGRILSFVLGGIVTGALLSSAYHYPLETSVCGGLSFVFAGSALKLIHSKQKRAMSDLDKRWFLTRLILDEVWTAAPLASNAATLEDLPGSDEDTPGKKGPSNGLLSLDSDADWEKIEHETIDVDLDESKFEGA